MKNAITCIEKKDKIFLIILFAVLVLFYNEQADIRIILRASDVLVDAIRQGRILDFYSMTLEYDASTYFIGMAANYNILVYLFVLVLTLPIRLLRLIFGLFGGAALISEDLMVLYLHAQVACFALLLLLQIEYLVKELLLIGDSSEEDANRLSVVACYLTGFSPLFLIAVVGYTQIDVIYMLLTVVALRFYIRGKLDAFSWIMAVAIAFKTFPVIFFVPLLLAAEKRILPLIRHLAEGASLTVLFWLLYGRNAGYKEVQAQFPEFMERLFEVTLPNGREGSVPLLVCGMALFCFFCYWLRWGRTFSSPKSVPFVTKTDGKDRNYPAMIVTCMLVPSVLITLFFNWNVNYLIMPAVAFGLALPFVKNKNRFIAIEMVGFVGFLVYWMLDFWHWYGICDAYLFLDIFGYERPAVLPDFAGIFGDKADVISAAALAVFVAAVIMQTIIVFADGIRGDWKAYDIANDDGENTLLRGYIYLPVLVLAAFLVIHGIYYFMV